MFAISSGGLISPRLGLFARFKFLPPSSSPSFLLLSVSDTAMYSIRLTQNVALVPRVSSTNAETSSLEFIGVEPSWKVDHRIGFGIEEHAVCEYEHQRTTDSVSAFNTPQPVPPPRAASGLSGARARRRSTAAQAVLT